MKRDAHLRLYDLRVWRMPVSSSNSTPSTEYNRVEHIHVSCIYPCMDHYIGCGRARGRVVDSYLLKFILYDVCIRRHQTNTHIEDRGDGSEEL